MEDALSGSGPRERPEVVVVLGEVAIDASQAIAD
jgi:hypothetical protein